MNGIPGSCPILSTSACEAYIRLYTSTYAQSAVGEHRGWDYARSGNPTRDALEEALASLEGGAHGVAFSSGLAAGDAVLRTLAPGDHVLMANDVYGGTYRQFSKVHEPWGLVFDPIDLADPGIVDDAWRPETRMMWIETPTNPLMSIFDGVVFSDIGNVFRTASEFSLTDLRKTAGLGLRVRTRWFLIRGDYGVPLDRRAGERRGRFYFSLGQAF